MKYLGKANGTPIIQFKKIPFRPMSVRGVALRFVIFTRVQTVDPYYVEHIWHELVHIERQKAMGSIKWFYRYFSDRMFRESEELVARQEASKRKVTKWQSY